MRIAAPQRTHHHHHRHATFIECPTQQFVGVFTLETLYLQMAPHTLSESSCCTDCSSSESSLSDSESSSSSSSSSRTPPRQVNPKKYTVSCMKCLDDKCYRFFLNNNKMKAHLYAQHELRPMRCPIGKCTKSFRKR